LVELFTPELTTSDVVDGRIHSVWRLYFLIMANNFEPPCNVQVIAGPEIRSM
jgi:hypothetical protein